MAEQFMVTALQLAKFFAFIIFGYLVRRLDFLPEQSGTVLSKLEVALFLPALVFRTMASNFRLEVILAQGPMILVSLAIVAVTFFLSRPLARLFSKDPDIIEVYSYSFTVPNIGYLGYPLVLGLFGELMLFHFMIYAIPYQIFIYSVGVYMLNPYRTFSFKALLNPSMLALAGGIIVGLFGLQLPQVANDTLDLAAACMAPIAMILTGFVLGSFAPRQLLAHKKMHLASIFRLLLIPLLALFILRWIGLDAEIIMLAVILLSLPFGLNSVIFPQTYGVDSSEGARLCFASHLYSLVSLPLVTSLLLYLLTS